MRSLKEMIMGRPKTLKPEDGGEVVLKNCTPETTAKIQAALSGSAQVVAKEAEVSVTTNVIEMPAKPSDDADPMPCSALGLYQHPLTLSWHLCNLKFSPYTKKGKVESDIPVGRDKLEAGDRFKIEAVKNGLV